LTQQNNVSKEENSSNEFASAASIDSQKCDISGHSRTMDRKQMRVLVEPLSNALKLQSITSFLKTQHAQTTFHIAVN